LKIASAQLLLSAAHPSQFPQSGLVEIAFAGRSNVGKSSLINNLLRRPGLARTSSTPGRTQQINFFTVNCKFLFVDLPGYGYARVPQAVQATWMKLLRSYLEGREPLAQVLLIVDSRLGPTPLDLEMLEWLQFKRLPYSVISTKADKLSKMELQKSVQYTSSLAKGAPVVPFSAVNNLGHDKIWSLLLPLVETRQAQPRPVAAL
jgi:GTP-binding protein